MIAIDFLFTCDHVLFDRSRKLSIIGIFNLLNAKKLPLSHPSFFVVMRLRGGSGKQTIELAIRHSTGEIVQEQSNEIEMQQDVDMDFAIQVIGTTFEKEGKYLVEVKADGKVLKTTEIQLLLKQKTT